MIREVTYYVVACDCCGEDADYGDFSAMSDHDGATEYLSEDWASTTDGEHLCFDCWTSAPDDAESDDPVRAHATHPKSGDSDTP